MPPTRPKNMIRVIISCDGKDSDEVIPIESPQALIAETVSNTTGVISIPSTAEIIIVPVMTTTR